MSENQFRLTRLREPEDKQAVLLTNNQKHMITMDTELYEAIMHYINNTGSKECLWYNLIVRIGDANSQMVCYDLRDIFIPHQTVADKEVEASGKEIEDMWKEIKQLKSLSNREVIKLSVEASMWGHSHVTMPPRPSPQDDKQWTMLVEKALEKFKDASLPAEVREQPIGMVIFNRDGKYTNKVLDLKLGLHLHNIPIITRDKKDYSYIDEAIKTKLHVVEPPPEPKKEPENKNYSQPHYNGYNNTSGTSGKITNQWHGEAFASPTPQQIQAQEKQIEPISTFMNQATTQGISNKYSFLGNYPRAKKNPIIVKALNHLENLSEKVFKDNNTVNSICKVIADLNGVKQYDFYNVRKGVNDILAIILSYSENKMRTVWEHRIDMALWIYDRITRNIALSPSHLIEDMMEHLNAFNGKIENVETFFSKDTIAPEQLFILALAIAVLVDNCDQSPEGIARAGLAREMLDHFITLCGADE